MHPTRYDGKYFKIAGTFTVPRSAQGHPVLLQAGMSGRGLAFAGRWAEVVFTAFRNRDAGVKVYRSIRQAVGDAGRDPELVKVTPAVGVIVAESPEQVKLKEALLRGCAYVARRHAGRHERP